MTKVKRAVKEGAEKGYLSNFVQRTERIEVKHGEAVDIIVRNVPGVGPVISDNGLLDAGGAIAPPGGLSGTNVLAMRWVSIDPAIQDTTMVRYTSPLLSLSIYIYIHTMFPGQSCQAIPTYAYASSSASCQAYSSSCLRASFLASSGAGLLPLSLPLPKYLILHAAFPEITSECLYAMPAVPTSKRSRKLQKHNLQGTVSNKTQHQQQQHSGIV